MTDEQQSDLLIDGYRVVHVYASINPTQRLEVARFWVREGVLDPKEAQRRSAEVMFMVRDQADELVGVNTVYVANLRTVNDPWFFMRMFLCAEHRGCYALTGGLMQAARRYLRCVAAASREGTPQGLVLVTENPKLWRKGVGQWLRRTGWVYFGKGPAGNQVWIDPFTQDVAPR